MEALLLSANRALLAEAGKTVLIGVLVVFSVLVLLTLIFRLFGLFSGVKSAKKPVETTSDELPGELLAAVAGAIAAESDEISDEVVAVIAAAICAMSDGNTRYAIRRITPVDNAARSAWSTAGVLQNTQPF